MYTDISYIYIYHIVMDVVPMCLWGKAQKDPRSDPYISACLGTKSTQHVQPQRGYFGAAWHWHRLQRHPLRDKVARFLGFAKVWICEQLDAPIRI